MAPLPPVKGISPDAKRGMPMSTGICPSPLTLAPDSALRGQTAVADKLHKAACPVAALLDLAAVGVENPVAKIDVVAARFFNDQYLIAAHTEVTVGQALQPRRAQLDPLGDAVKHDKIVAQSLH